MGDPSIYKIGQKVDLKFNADGTNGENLFIVDDEGRLVYFQNSSPYNKFIRFTVDYNTGVVNKEEITVSKLNENRGGQILYSKGYFYLFSLGGSPTIIVYKFKLDDTYLFKQTYEATISTRNPPIFCKQINILFVYVL